MRRSSPLIAAVVTSALLVPAALTAAPKPRPTSETPRDAVTLEGVREHQAALQAIADAGGGTRAS
jgi:hypothetical protein